MKQKNQKYALKDCYRIKYRSFTCPPCKSGFQFSFVLSQRIHQAECQASYPETYRHHIRCHRVTVVFYCCDLCFFICDRCCKHADRIIRCICFFYFFCAVIQTGCKCIRTIFQFYDTIAQFFGTVIKLGGTILNLSVMTSVQQSIMNFGILMVQGLANSFGTVIMAAFAAAVKIDSFAYMPVQDFGNAFSTYVAQNYGANRPDRIKKGIRSAGLTSAVFCIVISVLVCAFAAPLMGIFIDPAQTEIIAAGVQYLRIEGACYIGIGVLFLLYGYYRAVNQPGMSVILTIASLGTRVALAYLLSATPLGVTGIWLSVPIGWALADAIGIGYYLKKRT